MIHNSSYVNNSDVVTNAWNSSTTMDFPSIYVAPLWRTDFTLAVLYCILVGVALLLGTFGNLIILTVTLTTDAMNKIGKYFVVNLALADLCVAGIADPMCIIGVIKGEEWFNDKWILCEVVASMCLTACFCAFLSLTNVTVNRYMYVCHYNLYHKIYTKTSTFFLCLSCWILAFLFEFPNFIGWGDHYFDQKNHQCIWDRTADLSYTNFVAAGLIGSPLCLMGMCFVLIFRKIWKTKYDVYSIDKEDPDRLKKAWTESLKASKTLIAIFFVFIVCWTPYAIITAIDVDNTFSMETHLFVTLLAHLHSSLNILIYTFSNKNFRKNAFGLLTCGKEVKYKTDSEVDKTTSSGFSSQKSSDKHKIYFTNSLNGDLKPQKQPGNVERGSVDTKTDVMEENGVVYKTEDQNHQENGTI